MLVADLCLDAAGAGACVAYGWRRAGLAGLALIATAPLSPTHAEDEDNERPPLSLVIFGSMEAGPSKTFMAAGMKRALGGTLGESGFRLFLKAGGSREQTRPQRPHGITDKAEAQTMLGYEWRIGDSFLALYGGSDVENERRIEPLTVSPVTTRYGARLQADLWALPADGMMLQANGYVSSIQGRLWGRLAPGWQVPAGFYVGPELEAYRESDYRKLRFGLHLTGFRLLGLAWRLSGGWQTTSDRPSALYATLGVHWLR